MTKKCGKTQLGGNYVYNKKNQYHIYKPNYYGFCIMLCRKSKFF